MAPTETKFRISRIVMSAAVFISLCAPSLAEVRRCYWCGPLAEQVHRSQRALPCSGGHTQVTVCDPGFPYCAVVATSPPYIESRYCVKLYQDECYSLYCNSTRTWRMTCPCRGDLCNGPNTEREDEAFIGLAKIVSKAQNLRIRRALITTSSFISNKKYQIDNTTFEENKESDVKQNENQINDIKAITQNTNYDTKDLENQITDTVINSIDVKSHESQMEETSQSTPSVITDEVVTTNGNQMNETSLQIDIPPVHIDSDDLKTEIILMSSQSTDLVNGTKVSEPVTTNENIPNINTTPSENIKQPEIETKAVTETTTEAEKTSPTEVTIENKMKPLPTAEALQHNETPVAKTTEQTEMRTSTITMQQNEATTQANRPRNNTAVQINAHILTIFVGVILHY